MPGEHYDVRPGLDSQPWWDALAEGRVTVPRCARCERTFFPPQARCPHCGSNEHRLEASSGDATVYSWVVTHRSFAPEFDEAVPYAIVAVDLDGTRLIGRFGGELSSIREGLPVRARPRPERGYGALWFDSRERQ